MGKTTLICNKCLKISSFACSVEKPVKYTDLRCLSRRTKHKEKCLIGKALKLEEKLK